MTTGSESCGACGKQNLPFSLRCVRCGAAIGSAVGVACAAPSPSLAGETLGPYALAELVGRGSFADVYRATAPDRGVVAVKVLAQALRGSPGSRKRFLGEAVAMQRLDHPNVAPIFDVGDKDGIAYLVMPLYTGGSLRDRLSGSRLPVRTAVSIARCLAGALAAAHDAAIVHRDLKPENVLFDCSDSPMLTDFGLARLADEPRMSDSTQDRATVGTLPYVAPEALRGEPVDPRADLWALGVVLYEMIAGEQPFRDAEEGLVKAVLAGHYAALASKNAEIPVRLGRLVNRLLAPDPHRRAVSANGVCADLDVVAVEDLATPPAQGLSERPVVRPSSLPSRGLVIAERYRLHEEIARGGMGSVWRADHLGLRVPCAVKLLRHELDGVAHAQNRFLDEANVLARLEHPNIARVYDAGLHRGRPFIAMELLEGETLKARLERTGTVDLDEALGIAGPVASALEAAHRVGVIHRDLKPENLIIESADDGTTSPKVLDFGISKLTRPADDASTTSASGAVIGTPAYMSPEQIAGNKVDQRTDVWALAVIVYRMLTGVLPFRADGLPELALRISSGRFVPPTTLSPALPPRVDAVFERAFAPDPERRFDTPRAFVRGLDAARPAVQDAASALASDDTALAPTETLDPVAPAVPPAPARSRAAPVAVAIVLLGAAALFAGMRSKAGSTSADSSRHTEPSSRVDLGSADAEIGSVTASAIPVADHPLEAGTSPAPVSASTSSKRVSTPSGRVRARVPGASVPAATGTMDPTMFDRRD